MLLGMEEFLFRLAADGARSGRRGGGGDPELAKKLHRLLEFALAVTTRYAYAQIEAGAHNLNG